MFTPEERERIRVEILEAAKKDKRIASAAITGSASVGRLDAWSDIDLAFGVKQASETPNILKDFTEKMYRSYGALDHLDVPSGSWIYCVFFLANTLQVDLAFVPQSYFGPRAPTFKLVFGTENQISHDPPANKNVLVGWAWLYALHVRACIKRGEFWRAEYMISGMRDQVISLCCLRHNLPERHGRGVDRLPGELKEKLELGLIRSLQAAELQRAFKAVIDVLVDEIYIVDKSLGSRIAPALSELSF